MDDVELLLYGEALEVQAFSTELAFCSLTECFCKLVVVEKFGALLLSGIYNDIDATIGSVAHIPKIVGITNPVGLYIVIIYFARILGTLLESTLVVLCGSLGQQVGVEACEEHEE
jgi:hypothetical protein